MKSDKSFAILLSVLSALFFAVTFVLNRQISAEGGHWIWSSSLRYFWMIPFLSIIVIWKRQLRGVINEIKKQPSKWILWSTIGFGAFYAPLTFAAAYGPSWLVASTFQITIIAGMLVSPLIHKTRFSETFSLRSFIFSLTILLGIAIMQVNQAQVASTKEILLGTVPVLVAAFAYPLGNRKMMQITNGSLTAFQRTLGMTLCSLPVWIMLSLYGVSTNNFPTQAQISQTLIIGICSGVIATTLFYMATDRVRKDEKSLAAVEATQSAEVLFALLGEILIVGMNLPDVYSMAGMALVISGMLLHSFKK